MGIVSPTSMIAIRLCFENQLRLHLCTGWMVNCAFYTLFTRVKTDIWNSRTCIRADKFRFVEITSNYVIPPYTAARNTNQILLGANKTAQKWKLRCAYSEIVNFTDFQGKIAANRLRWRQQRLLHVFGKKGPSNYTSLEPLFLQHIADVEVSLPCKSEERPEYSATPSGRRFVAV